MNSKDIKVVLAITLFVVMTLSFGGCSNNSLRSNKEAVVDRVESTYSLYISDPEPGVRCYVVASGFGIGVDCLQK
jgi:hypothetical protein